MRKFLVLGVIALVSGIALASPVSQEVLVGTTPTKMPRSGKWTGFEIQNRGPNSIFCTIGLQNTDGGSPVYVDGGLIDQLNMTREIAAGDAWPGQEPTFLGIWCVSSAAQVSGAATIYTEAP